MSARRSKRKKKSIFFSYSTKDEAIVKRIYDAVQRLGGSPYVDMLDLEMQGTIPEQLATAISSCDSFVVFLSRNSLDSGWVIAFELSLAITRENDEKRNLLVLVNLDGLDRKKDFPEVVRDRPSISLSGGTEKAIEKAAKAIVDATTPRKAPKGSKPQRPPAISEEPPAPAAPEPRLTIEAVIRFGKAMRIGRVKVEVIAQNVNKALGTDATILIDWHNNPGWKLRSSFGFDFPSRLDLDEFLTLYANPKELLDGRPSHSRYADESNAPYSSALWAPLKRHGLLFGALGVFLARDSTRTEFHTYDRENLVALAEIIADQLCAGRSWRDACVIHNRKEQERECHRIIDFKDVHAHFQPVISGWTGQIAGHAVLTAGPESSSLHGPAELAEQAKRLKRIEELAEVSLTVMIDALANRRKPLSRGALTFIRIPPGLMKSDSRLRDILAGEPESLRPWCTILELSQIGRSPNALRKRAEDLIRAGFALGVADFRRIIDDPAQILALSPQWLRISTPSTEEDWKRLAQSLETIKPCGVKVIADGIRSVEDVSRCWQLGIGFFQGDALAERASDPLSTWSPADREIAEAISSLPSS